MDNGSPMHKLLGSMVNTAIFAALFTVGCQMERDRDTPEDGCWVGNEDGEVMGKAEFGECHPLDCGAVCFETDLGGEYVMLGEIGTPCDPVPSHCSGVASFDEDYDQ